MKSIGDSVVFFEPGIGSSSRSVLLPRTPFCEIHFIPVFKDSADSGSKFPRQEEKRDRKVE